MALQDKVIEETKERKNAVEEYVYTMRSKISDQLSAFVDDATRESFGALLNATEDWLYEGGEDESKGVYVAKLEELRAIGEPIETRAKEEYERPGAISKLTDLAQRFLAMSGDEDHAHIESGGFGKGCQGMQRRARVVERKEDASRRDAEDAGGRVAERRHRKEGGHPGARRDADPEPPETGSEEGGTAGGDRGGGTHGGWLRARGKRRRRGDER